MTRRNLVKAASMAAVTGGAAAAAPSKKSFIELRYYRLRNGAVNQRQILTDHLSKGRFPALKRAGAGPLGAFSNTISPDGPYLLTVTNYPDFASIEAVAAKMAADKEYQKSRDAMLAQTQIPYVRLECSLLRGFDTMPSVVAASAEGRTGNRLFELRIYESNNMETARRKVGMFDNGEIEIFRKYGIQPVFFGETIFGKNMPNISYMVGFDDWAGREKAWKAFASSPEWQKLRATPGLSDAEIVCNISNTLLSPLPFSEVK